MNHPVQVCGRTGLALARATGESVFRIAKSSYGPMNPVQRDLTEDPRAWSRFDVGGHRTIYAASPAAGAYAESLAAFRPELDVKLTDLFDDEDPLESRTLRDVVGQEWDQLACGFKPGYLPASWRRERLEYRLTLPSDGWFVDIENSASIAAIAGSIGGELAGLGLKQLTVANLRSETRAVTTTIATWVHGQVLEDGSLPHGIFYGSKHGSNWSNWAIWLRLVDDGDDPGRDIHREPTRADNGREIGPYERNTPLRTVADLFELHCY
jgi:hypothetical protein